MPILEVKNLFKFYKDVKAVNGLNLKIDEGSCFGLLGPNGAGKSTTLEVIEGIKPATSGEILYQGQPRTKEFFETIGIQFQSTALQDFMTVREALETFSMLYKKSVPIDELIEICHLGEYLDRDHRRVSGGQRQRLLLAIALVNDPNLVFLDEPTTGLDPQSRVNFWDLIKEIKSRGKTIVLTTHYMDEAFNLCDEISIVDHGQVIAEGAPEALLSKHFRAKKVSLPLDFKNNVPSDFPWETFEANRRLQFHVESVNDLLSYFDKKNLSVDALEIHSQTLEDLFIHLTGKTLRI